MLLLLLTACGITPEQEMAATSTRVPSLTWAVLSTETAVPTPLPQILLSELRIVYSLDGDLYFQNGYDSPVQLTRGKEEDTVPGFSFSEDAKKVIFFRKDPGAPQRERVLYSIDTDGNNEQVLVSQEWLDQLGSNTSLTVYAHVPQTHELLFGTSQCDTAGNCRIGIFLVDLDNGKIKEFLKPRSVGNLLWHDFYQVSPDGRMVAVALSGRVDIFNIDGEIVYPNIMTYKTSTPIELVPMLSWLSDSSGLVAALPDEDQANSPVPSSAYRAWRYLIGSHAVQIPLGDEQPVFNKRGCSDDAFVSPDGKWFLYPRRSTLYLGNLDDGGTQIYASGCPWPGDWSPNGQYFVFRDIGSIFYIGSIGFAPKPIDKDDVISWFLGWIDSSRYLFLRYGTVSGEDHAIFVGEINDGVLVKHETGLTLPKNVAYYDIVLLYGEATHP